MRFFPGVSVAGMRAGAVPVLTVANCAAHIPNGGAVGQYYGGWLAVSDEVAALMQVNYTIAVTAAEKPRRVPEPKPPEGVRELERKAGYAVSQAERFRAKHRRRDERSGEA